MVKGPSAKGTPSDASDAPGGTRPRLPPGQQLAAPGRWPTVGERLPRRDDAPWTVGLAGLVAEPRTWSLAELAARPQIEVTADIHCVTRWSKLAVRFRGVPLAALLEGAGPLPEARFVSFIARSERAHSTSLPLADALSLGTLLVLEAEGQPLTTEHGGPVRTVTPGRYFYKSLKWLERIELLAEDRLGYWEAESGYHNTADPQLEQRYMAPALSRAEMRTAIASRDFRRRDLRSLAAAGASLEGLRASGALLRDADFRGASLAGADFEGANLSNAHLRQADLRRARLVGADCEGAHFAAADLRGADFRGASVFGATFCDLDEHGQVTALPVIDAETQFGVEQLEQLAPPQREVWESLLRRAPGEI